MPGLDRRTVVRVTLQSRIQGERGLWRRTPIFRSGPPGRTFRRRTHAQAGGQINTATRTYTVRWRREFVEWLDDDETAPDKRLITASMLSVRDPRPNPGGLDENDLSVDDVITVADRNGTERAPPIRHDRGSRRGRDEVSRPAPARGPGSRRARGPGGLAATPMRLIASDHRERGQEGRRRIPTATAALGSMLWVGGPRLRIRRGRRRRRGAGSPGRAHVGHDRPGAHAPRRDRPMLISTPTWTACGCCPVKAMTSTAGRTRRAGSIAVRSADPSAP